MWLWGSACVAIAITSGMVNYVLKRPAGLAPNDRGLRKMFRLASEIALPTTLAATLGGELSSVSAFGSLKLTCPGPPPHSCAAVLASQVAWRLQLVIGVIS